MNLLRASFQFYIDMVGLVVEIVGQKTVFGSAFGDGRVALCARKVSNLCANPRWREEALLSCLEEYAGLNSRGVKLLMALIYRVIGTV